MPDKQPTTDDWPVERTWTIDCSRCKDEGQAYEDTASPEWAIWILKDLGWTLEWDTKVNPIAYQITNQTPPDGVWRAYCPRCNARKPTPDKDDE